jgi:hypothetical protein
MRVRVGDVCNVASSVAIVEPIASRHPSPWTALRPVSLQGDIPGRWPTPTSLVLTVDRQREAAKPLGTNAELPLEPRLGEKPENDAVCALKHDVFGHARRGFRPAELSVERSHASDIPTGEHDCADPCWDAYQATSVWPQSGTFPHAASSERVV